jgi:hypothetical protein
MPLPAQASGNVTFTKIRFCFVPAPSQSNYAGAEINLLNF